MTEGVVRTLTVEQPDVCPVREDYDEHSRLHVQAVSGGKMTYSDVERAAKSINSDCGTVVVGDEDNTGEEL